MKLKLLDIPAIALSLGVTVLAAFSVYGKSSAQARLIVESGNKSWVYVLDTDQEIHIPGRLGNTVIHIINGRAFVTESPCANKTCVKAPPLEKNGDWTACLPNGVLLRVEGSSRPENVDATVR